MAAWYGNNRFRCDHQIGEGSFGKVFSGPDVETGAKIALKLEPVTAKHPALFEEAKLYKSGMCIPNAHWVGEEGGYRILVADLL